jgi:beta-phosphoglucomutase-like phosphatase (HAD superfamily)
MLQEYGYQVNTEEYQRKFSGAATFKRLEVTSQKSNWTSPKNYMSVFNERVSDLTERELKPVPGIHFLIESLSMPICIASNGSREEIVLRLKISS